MTITFTHVTVLLYCTPVVRGSDVMMFSEVFCTINTPAKRTLHPSHKRDDQLRLDAETTNKPHSKNKQGRTS